MRKPNNWGHSCPNPDCSHYRLMNRGNIRAIATYITAMGRPDISPARLRPTTNNETKNADNAG